MPTTERSILVKPGHEVRLQGFLLIPEGESLPLVALPTEKQANSLRHQILARADEIWPVHPLVDLPLTTDHPVVAEEVRRVWPEWRWKPADYGRHAFASGCDIDPRLHPLTMRDGPMKADLFGGNFMGGEFYSEWLKGHRAARAAAEQRESEAAAIAPIAPRVGATPTLMSDAPRAALLSSDQLGTLRVAVHEMLTVSTLLDHSPILAAATGISLIVEDAPTVASQMDADRLADRHQRREIIDRALPSHPTDSDVADLRDAVLNASATGDGAAMRGFDGAGYHRFFGARERDAILRLVDLAADAGGLRIASPQTLERFSHVDAPAPLLARLTESIGGVRRLVDGPSILTVADDRVAVQRDRVAASRAVAALRDGQEHAATWGQLDQIVTGIASMTTYHAFGKPMAEAQGAPRVGAAAPSAAPVVISTPGLGA